MKKKARYRILSIALALLMIMGVMPTMSIKAAENSYNAEEYCGYRQPVVLDVGEIDEPSVVSEDYYASSDAYWDSFGSDYYYNQLNSEEKNLYKGLYSACMELLTSQKSAEVLSYGETNYYRTAYVNMGNLDRVTAQKIAVILQISNPQFYFINDMMMWGYSSAGNQFALGVYDDFADGIARTESTSRIRTKLDTWIAAIKQQPSLIDMEKKAHDIVVENTIYASGNYHQSSAGTLLEGMAVCAGYAETFEMLCNAVGISAICVTSEDHEWNKVKLYGRWYVVDCTWDDGGNSGYYGYEFFNISDRSASAGNASHTQESWWDSYNVPACINDDVIVTKEYIYQGIDYSPVFDADYYLSANQDLQQAYGANEEMALAHFVNYGMAEGRQASPEFNVNVYRNRYKDLRQAYGNNYKAYYMHYINYGKQEGRTATGSAVITDGITVYNGVDYASVYDYSFYIKNNPDIASAYPNDDMAALAHFINYGMAEGRQGSAEFNVFSYYNKYADLRAAYGHNWKSYYMHYLQYGKREGRIGTGTAVLQGTTVYNGIDYAAVYDYNFYVAAYPDIKAAYGMDDVAALAHFVNYGMAEGRQGCSGFDVNSYRLRYKDLRINYGNDLKAYYIHYLNYGFREGRVATGQVDRIDGVTVYNGVDYSPIYDYNFYIAAYPDVKAAYGIDDAAVLAHFVNYGMAEGRQGCSNFNVNSYKNNYSDLRSAFGDNLPAYYMHYLNYGRTEGRTGL